MTIELVGIGLLIGIFTGISGVGGGSVMTPLLILVLGINPLLAVGTDLIYSVPTKILGAIVHARQKTIDWTLIRWLLAGGIPGVVLGVVVLLLLRHYVDFNILAGMMKRAVGIALFISAAALLYSVIFRSAEVVEDTTVHITSRSTHWKLIFAGAFVGFFVALTSIGSGSITLPLLFLIAPFVGIRRLIGSDITFAAFLVPLAAGGHWSLGDVNLPVAMALLVGSLPGVYIGSKLCRRLPEIWLRPAVATVLIVAGTRLI